MESPLPDSQTGQSAPRDTVSAVPSPPVASDKSPLNMPWNPVSPNSDSLSGFHTTEQDDTAFGQLLFLGQTVFGWQHRLHNR